LVVAADKDVRDAKSLGNGKQRRRIMPSITTREYNPTTGAFVSNISSLSYGRIVVGTHSPVKVIDFAFTGVAAVSDVKLGLMDAGGVVVNPSPSDPWSDGSAGNGNFGCMHSVGFSSQTAQGPLTRHYAGLNTSGLASDTKNIKIGQRSDTVSQFVYLDMLLGSNDVGQNAGLYKVFFDFE